MQNFQIATVHNTKAFYAQLVHVHLNNREGIVVQRRLQYRLRAVVVDLVLDVIATGMIMAVNVRHDHILLHCQPKHAPARYTYVEGGEQDLYKVIIPHHVVLIRGFFTDRVVAKKYALRRVNSDRKTRKPSGPFLESLSTLSSTNLFERR